MSIKRFCDVCDNEISENVVSSRIKEEVSLPRRNGQVLPPRVNVEITVGVNGTWNKGDLCRSCLFSALDRLDTRDKGAP